MYNRRDFIKLSGAVSAAALMARFKGHANTLAGPDVYEAFDDGMVEGGLADRAKVVEEVVINAVDSIIKTMSGEPDLGAAWQQLFPGITETSKVAIKLNLLKNYNGPQFATLKAVVNGLKSMFGGGFTGEISVFDNDWNNRLLKVDTHYAGYDLAGLGVWHKEDAYNGDQIQIVGNTMNVSTKLSEAAYGIDMAASRRHHLYAGSFTGMIKNMIGAVSKQAGAYVCLSARDNGEFHDNSNFQSYVDLFQNYMKDNLHLYIADHILIPLDKSKEFYDKTGKTIVIGTDPCAVDSRSVDILKTHYPDTEITKAVPEALEAAGIGATDYALHSVSLASTGRYTRGVQKGTGITLCLAASPFKRAQVSFPNAGLSGLAVLEIYTPEGRRLRRIPVKSTGGEGRLILWDGRDNNQTMVKPGVVIVRFKNRGQTISRQMVLET